jgi:hypothetical protein
MLKKGVQFGLNTSILLALFAASFSFGLHKNWSENKLFSLAVFFSILGVYNFHRWYKFKKKQVQPFLEKWVQKNKKSIILLSFIGLFSSCSLFLYLIRLHPKLILLLAICFLISLLYVLLKLRELPFIKALIVSFIWTFVLVILPAVLQKNYEHSNWSFLLLFYALTIPADARDLETDAKKFNTLPQLIGKQAAYSMSLLCISVFVISQNFLLSQKFYLIILITIAIILFFELENKQKIRVEWFDAILVLFGCLFYYC